MTLDAPMNKPEPRDFKIIFTSRDDGLSQQLILPGDHAYFLKALKLEGLEDVTEAGTFHLAEAGTFHLAFEDAETRTRWSKVFENSFRAKAHNAKASEPFKLEDNEE